MTRAEQTDAIVEARLAARDQTKIRNPDQIRSYIRSDLNALSDRDLTLEYERLTGTRRQPGAKDYDATLLDRAVSDALTMLGRPYLDHTAIGSVLTEDYDAEIAGQALALALERSEQPVPPPSGVKFVEYQATLGRAEDIDA